MASGHLALDNNMLVFFLLFVSRTKLLTMTRPVVTLDQSGRGCFLVGENTTARGCDKPVKAFLGIPYAQPPVGELRFKLPQKVCLWPGFREANSYGNVY